MIGAMLAFRPDISIKGGRGSVIALVALGGISLSSLRPSMFAVMGLQTLVPVMGSGALIYTRESWVNQRILASALPRQIGLISYPLYLWHWPILAFLQIWTFGELSWLEKIVALAASVALAWLTYRLIERPPFKRYPMALVASMGGTALASAFVAIDGAPDRAVTRDARSAFVERYDVLRFGLAADHAQRCDFYDNFTFQARAAIPQDCVPSRPMIALWGDSHAKALFPGLRSLAPTMLLGTSGCKPSVHPFIATREPVSQACALAQRYAVEVITRKKPAVLVLAQASNHEKTDWIEIARWAHARGIKHVVLVGPAPEWYPSLPAIVAKSYWRRDRSRISEGLDAPTILTDREMKHRLDRSSELTYISLMERLCDPRGCLGSVPGSAADELMAVDYGHFSPLGARFVGRHILGPVISRYLEPGNSQ
jgi:hypothetical protein